MPVLGWTALQGTIRGKESVHKVWGDLASVYNEHLIPQIVKFYPLHAMIFPMIINFMSSTYQIANLFLVSTKNRFSEKSEGAHYIQHMSWIIAFLLNIISSLCTSVSPGSEWSHERPGLCARGTVQDFVELLTTGAQKGYAARLLVSISSWAVQPLLASDPFLALLSTLVDAEHQQLLHDGPIVVPHLLNSNC